MSDPERAEARPYRSTSGIEIKPVYGPSELDGFDPEQQLGQPGGFPYTRGVHPDGYRGRPWTMRQYAGFGSAEETNRRFRYLLERGQTGLSVAFDLPTQMGYDSDDPMAAGEVGRTGVPIDSVNPGGGNNCTFTENTFSGGTINVQGTCQETGAGTATMSMEGSYTPTTMEAEITSEVQAPQGAAAGGPQTVRMSGTFTSRRTGDCPAS